MLVNYNGRWLDRPRLDLPVNDATLLYGDSLFETLKLKDGHCLLSDAHLERMEDSCRRIALPFDRPALEAALTGLESRRPTGTYRIRLTVSRGPVEGLQLQSFIDPWFLLTAAEYREPTVVQRQNGVSAVLAPNQRVNPLSHHPQMKRGNYADCLYALDYAQQQGAREALFIDRSGHLLEGASSNLLLIREGLLQTPPLGNLILNGTMRHQIQLIAPEIGLQSVEKPLTLDDLGTAEEVLLCNSLIGTLPLARLEQIVLKTGGWAERIYLRLKASQAA